MPLLVVCSVGCGSGTPQGVSAGGTVTLDGKPLQNATAVFTPRTPGGFPTSVRIVEGRFQFDETQGLPAGEFDVCIIGAEPELEEVDAAHREGRPSPLGSSRIPAKYQQPGALTAAVTPDGPNEFEFALSSQSSRLH
jgi:hypothetical protein